MSTNNTSEGKMKEVWKDIEGYDGMYFVSNLGRIWSAKRGIIMKQNLTLKPQYYMVTFYKDKKIGHTVHSLVASAFLKKLKHHQVINHKDRNRLNNKSDNLEWVTYAENIHYSCKNRGGFVGAFWNTNDRVYTSALRIKGTFIWLGSYKTPEEAHIAYLMGSLLYERKNKYLPY